jgi:hypothetical protein
VLGFLAWLRLQTDEADRAKSSITGGIPIPQNSFGMPIRKPECRPQSQARKTFGIGTGCGLRLCSLAPKKHGYVLPRFVDSGMQFKKRCRKDELKKRFEVGSAGRRKSAGSWGTGGDRLTVRLFA